jgi:hypothetical protein
VKNKSRNKLTFETTTVIDKGKPKQINWAKESENKLEELGKLIVETYIAATEKDEEGEFKSFR